MRFSVNPLRRLVLDPANAPLRAPGFPWGLLMIAMRLRLNFPRVLVFVVRDLSREAAA